MEKIYILDAVNYLFRSYYAIGPMLSSEGKSTSALFGFIRSVQKLIRDFSPNHLVCVFDGPDNKKSRQAVYADYKMHRKGAPEDLFPQFEWAYEYCELAGIAALCIDGVEADDTMASIALWAERTYESKVFICSSDKDLMQLVNEDIFLLQLHKNNLIIDQEKVKEIYGVRPNQILDFLAIMGDASDNIPGLEGFGPKTAASLLQEFETLDFILAHPEKVKGEKKQQTLKEQKDRALMSRSLAKLNTDVLIPKDDAFYEMKDADREKLKEFFQKMSFRAFLKELEEAKPSLAKEPCQAALQKSYQLIDSEEKWQSLSDLLLKQEVITIDTETTDLSFMSAQLVGVGFSIEPAKAWYFPLNGNIERKRALGLLREFFSKSKASFVGHNLKYDWHILHQHKIPLSRIGFDTILASYVLDPQKRKHSLDDLSLEKFSHVKIPLKELIGSGKKQVSMKDVSIEKVKEYCCEDVDYTIRLKTIFEKELKEKELEKVFDEIEMPLLLVLAKMEQEGIYLSVEKLRVIGQGILQEIERLKIRIFQLAGEEFNLNSPKQLSEVLYQKLGIKSRTSSTSADVLEALQEDYPIAKELLEYRSLEKLRSTYVQALPSFVNPETGRIHCSFNQSVTATGRLSSQNPNLQNIPLDSKIRSCFQARSGYVFLGADYSQIELRLLAHFSQDEALMKAFREGKDVHTYTASLIYSVKEDDVSSEMRRSAKAVNFGIVYGQGAFGLSKQLGTSQKEAAKFIETYFARYPKVTAYLDACKQEARKKGFSTTLFGRKRPIPEILNKNPMIRQGAERLAVNTPLQGTAADLIKLAMIAIDSEIDKRKLQGKMILQVHDELIFEIPEKEVPVFEEIVKEKMEHVIALSVPIEVDMAVGKNWAEC